ncbi:MAG: HAD family hydrolase [Candidatus Sulfotelmatobacter sp.]
MPVFDCSAILFDLDGVLVDSTRSVDRQWRVWARTKGVDEEKIIAIAHGVRALEVIQRVAPHLNAEAEVRALERLEAEDREDVVVMPGALALVRAIAENRWCVVTSGTRHLASTRLAMVGLPIPRILITADDVTHGKPHPEPYLKGAELLGVAPKECLVIEDAPAGIQAAHAGGMKVIGLTSTFPAAALSEADAVLKRLGQVRVTSNNGEGLAVEIA